MKKGKRKPDGLVNDHHAVLKIDTQVELGEISPYLYGVCIEDVNHEIYGGIWSQLIFGESFAESEGQVFPDKFVVQRGVWYVAADSNENCIVASPLAGISRMLVKDTTLNSGVISVILRFSGEPYTWGRCGLLISDEITFTVTKPFMGYEICLSASHLHIIRHGSDQMNMFSYDCAIEANNWLKLRVQIFDSHIIVYINDFRLADHEVHDWIPGIIGLSSFDTGAEFRNLTIKSDINGIKKIDFPSYVKTNGVSSMWRPVERGSAKGRFQIGQPGIYKKKNYQQFTFLSGSGAVGINNMSLNRKGMYYEAGRVYEGYFYARAKKDTVLWIVLESEDGKKLYAQNAIGINSEDWQQYHFALTPEQTEIKGRITIELRSKGSIDIGYILFQPGEWGRYKNLNVRKDVAEKLHELHVTIMRFGGSMINNPNYKWKYMLNKPEERIEYAGTWYNYSSMGFGIIEFMELCEALGIPGIPVFNSYETHQDISDFIDFALSVDEQNIWVRERLKRGHQQPYRLPYLEFGNEERVDEDFMQRFIEMADQVWSKTIDTQLIIGDFAFINPIEDPYRIKSTEAPSGISSLEPYKKLLDHSVKSGRSIWFDLHWDTSKPDIKNEFNGVDSFIKWLKIISPESLFKIVILELNADKHDFERALANALTINRAERRSGIYQILCSANGLQVDKNNDNYWNQGLIFFDHEQIWLQPPAFATQMASEYYLPYIVAYELTGCQDLDITISKNHDSSRLIIKCINISMNDWRVTLQLSRDLSLSNITRVVTLNSLKLDAVNKPGQYAVVPAIIQPNHLAQNTTVVFHAKSFTIIEIVDR